jgi:hypothetical protein
LAADLYLGSDPIVGRLFGCWSPKFHFLGIHVVARVLGGKLVAGDDLEAVEWFPALGPLPEMGFQEDVGIIEMCTNGATDG